ncbi:MAG: hypothetical protein K0S99_3368, partial [Thermomicrobiales bacterium]|nr:hypothetical protein [Thermomicrobiales bacterium]
GRVRPPRHDPPDAAPSRPKPLIENQNFAEGLLQAERDAEIAAAKARVAISLVLMVVVQMIIWGHLPGSDMPVAQRNAVLKQVENAHVFLGLLLALGVATYIAVRFNWAAVVRPFATAAADALLILGNIAHTLVTAEFPGGLITVLPVTFAVPLVMASAAIHYRPRLQLFVTTFYAAGLVLIVLLLGTGTVAARATALQNAVLIFGAPPNLVRLVMLLLLGGVLVLVTVRGRALLNRAVEETVHRTSLSRFLPAEIAPLLDSAEASSLRVGRRQLATLVFVDMRDSTARAESLEPRLLSVFISAFRRRVADAARAQGGVVDKFVGDGALVVFGVPEPEPDDAARALAFASDLLVRIDRWNRKRGFEPPVRIGIGLHTGEVYCGIVGDESRIEFTVLGDAVNVASRMEDATKRYGRSILATDATIAAAEAKGWTELGREVLRGRAQTTGIMAQV